MSRPVAVSRPVTAAATFCATLVDQWIRSGLSHAFVAPGSRSTPVALALTDRREIRLEVFHDERSASFAAVGHGLASGRPAIVLCSSGTAATHFHGAVVEAGLSCVPLIAITADRPPELIGVGAPQAIEQTELYGEAVRYFAEPGCPEDGNPASWRPLADEAWAAATGSTGSPGPAHLNLAFRDPLDGIPGPLPPPLPLAEGPSGLRRASGDDVEATAALIGERTGLIVAGAGLRNPAAVGRLADRLGWPLLADQRSGLSTWPTAVTHGDLIARANPLAPDVVIRFGEQPSSKALNRWVDDSGAAVVSATPHGRPIDPGASAVLTTPEAGLAEGLLVLGVKVSPGQIEAWTDAEAEVDELISRHTQERPGSELAVARTVAGSLDTDTNLVVSSSMPIRQLEWFGGPTEAPVYANRGANGIDGVIATAAGVALTAGPTVCLIGDVAVLHDSTSLVALARRSIDLTIVVTDNDGGGIFSHLPQATSLDSERFEQLFGTPHGTDIAALARAHGIPVEIWSSGSDNGALIDGWLPRPDGVRLVLAKTDRAESLARQRTLIEQVMNLLQSED